MTPFLETLVDREEISDSLSELQRNMRRATEELAKAEMSNIRQVQIVRELLNGRRTVTELVESLYGLSQDEPGFSTHYSQVQKELRELGSKGFVSRRPFGRNKPYRLTQLAVARLTMMDGVKKGYASRVIPGIDLVLYAGVLVVGSAGAWIAVNWETPFLIMAFTFVFLGGVAFCRFAEAMRRVIS